MADDLYVVLGEPCGCFCDGDDPDCYDCGGQTRRDDPAFVFRDVHPKHRPVWGTSMWNCTCGRYGAYRLADMQAHANRAAERELTTEGVSK